MGSAISRGISADYNKRQQEIQAQLAREEAERRAQLAKEKAERDKAEADQKMGQLLIGSWATRGGRTEYPGDHDTTNFELRFNADGTWSGRSDRWPDKGAAYKANRPATHEVADFSGTWTRQGNNVSLTYDVTTYRITWRPTRDRYVQSDTDSTSRSSTRSFVIHRCDDRYLIISAFEVFPGNTDFFRR
jgi:hypothetical protein